MVSLLLFEYIQLVAIASLKLMALVELMPGWLPYCTRFVANSLALVTFLFIVGRISIRLDWLTRIRFMVGG